MCDSLGHITKLSPNFSAYESQELTNLACQFTNSTCELTVCSYRHVKRSLGFSSIIIELVRRMLKPGDFKRLLLILGCQRADRWTRHLAGV